MEKPCRRNYTGSKVCVSIFFCSCLFLAFILSQKRWHEFSPLVFVILLNWPLVRILRFVMEVRRAKFEAYGSLLKSCFFFHGSFHLPLLISIFTMLFFKPSQKDLIALFTDSNYSLLEVAIFPSIVINLGLFFRWDDYTLTEAHRIEQNFSYSGGCHMALAYFYGYLKLTVPDILDKINCFQSRHGLSDQEFPEKKLFVLIPSSSFMLDKPHENGYETVEPLEEVLDVHTQHRGLILNRVYKHTVYKIKSEPNTKNYFYALLEGASPLKTFHDMLLFHSELREYKAEVISSFYYTLVRLLNENRDIKDLIELVYYDDEKYTDIGFIIRKRLEYLRKIRKSNEKKKIKKH